MKNKMMIRRILIGLFLGIVVTSCTHNDEYTFYIEKLTSSKMILTRGEDERFVFRKF